MIRRSMFIIAARAVAVSVLNDEVKDENNVKGN